MADDDKVTEPKTLSERVAANPEWGKDIGEKKTAKASALAEKERADTAETELATLKAEQTKTAEAAEQAKLEGQGKYDEALAKQKTSMQAEADKVAARADTAETRLRQIFGTDALKTELGAQGVKPELIDQAAQLLRNRIKVDLSGDKPVVTVMDTEGNPAFVEGNAADIKSLIASWLPDNRHFLPPTGDGGSGLHPSGTPGDKPITQAELLADPNKHAEWMDSFPPGESGEAFRNLPQKKE